MRLIYRYKKTRAKFRRARRLLFASPAEMKFVEIMGGHVVRLPLQDFRSHFPLVWVWWWPRIFRKYNVRRELQVGRYYVDFGSIKNHRKKAIEIDSAYYHQNIVAEQERDDYLHEHGFLIMHVRVIHIYRQPKDVKKKVVQFLKG